MAENLAVASNIIGALPDLHAGEQDVVADGDTVAPRFVVEATILRATTSGAAWTA